jgi:hypothetical protein
MTKGAKDPPVETNVIPENVRQFIVERIDSIVHMEALLLLFRNRGNKWDAASAANRLYVTEKEAAALLNQLWVQGFVVDLKGTYQYRAGDPQFEQLVGEVADAYAKHLLPVTNLIHTKPSARIREFADAFKLRTDR